MGGCENKTISLSVDLCMIYNNNNNNNIMEICKAPTLWLKALNKHMHIMYIEMENVIQKTNKTKKMYISTNVQA